MKPRRHGFFTQILDQFCLSQCTTVPPAWQICLQVGSTCSIWGAVLKRCTPLGRGDLPALPREGMDKLKSILKQQIPFAQRNPAEFEELWEVCIIAIQHLCERLRNN